MKTIAERLKFAMEKRVVNQPGLANLASTARARVSQQSIQKLLNKDKAQQSSRHLPAIAKALRIRIEWLAKNEEPMDAAAEPAAMVPEIDLVRAGKWGGITDPYQNGEAPMIAASSEVGPLAFALRVDGRSMMDLYRHGDLVIVDPEVRPEPGDDVIAKLDASEEATFKRYRRKTPKEVELLPLNTHFETLTIDARNKGRIVGVVVEHHRYPRGPK